MNGEIIQAKPKYTAMGRMLQLYPDCVFIKSSLTWYYEQYDPRRIDVCIYDRAKLSECRHIQGFDNITCCAPKGSPQYKDLLAKCRSGHYQAIVFFSIPHFFHDMVRQTHKDTCIVVRLIGLEVYCFINRRLHKPETRHHYVRHMIRRIGLLKFIASNSLSEILYNRFYPLERNLRALFKINYISTNFVGDYPLLGDRFRHLKLPPMLTHPIRGADEKFRDLTDNKQKGATILMNHSSAWNGNHLDVLSHLADLGVSNPILAPLSYGDPTYASLVRKRGKELFGEKFKSLDEFIGHEKYFQILGQCGYAVMGQLRHGGLGNINYMLYSGVKVFFYPENPMYAYYKQHGFQVYLLPEAVGSDFQSLLSPDMIQNNREACRKLSSEEKRNTITQEWFQTLGLTEKSNA